MEPEVFQICKYTTSGDGASLTQTQRFEIMAALGRTYMYATIEQLEVAYEAGANWCAFGLSEAEAGGYNVKNVVSHYNTATTCKKFPTENISTSNPNFGVNPRLVPGKDKDGNDIMIEEHINELTAASLANVCLHVYGIKPGPNRTPDPTSRIKTRAMTNGSVALDILGRGKFEYMIRPWNSETKQYYSKLDDVVPSGISRESRDTLLAVAILMFYIGVLSVTLLAYHVWHRKKHTDMYKMSYAASTTSSQFASSYIPVGYN